MNAVIICGISLMVGFASGFFVAAKMASTLWVNALRKAGLSRVDQLRVLDEIGAS